MIQKKHIAYFDFLRGIAIFMVVGIHTYIGGDFESSNGIIRIILRQTLNCAVPVFLCLSAFFLGKKDLNDKKKKRDFLRKQIPRVYIPCLIWSIPFFVISICEGDNIVISIVRLLVCGFSIYYFIALIIQYYVLLPLLQKKTNLLLILAGIITTFSIICITYIMHYKGIKLPLIVYAGPFTTWFVFYMLGIYNVDKLNYSLKYCLLLVLLGFLLEIAETYHLFLLNGSGVGIKLSAFIYSYGVILFVLHPRTQACFVENAFTNVVTYLGKISFGIYLIHCYIIRLINNISYLDIWFYRWMMALLITILIIIIARKYLPSAICKYIGF